MAMLGIERHLARLRKLASAEATLIGGAVAYEGVDTIRAEAHRLVSAGSVSGKKHEASAPGSPVNRDTGFLQANFETAQTGPASAEFRSKAEYSARHEFGPEGRSFMRPARDNKIVEVRKRYAAQMDAFVKRSG